MNLTTHQTTPQDSFAAAPQKEITQLEFQAMFLLLPQTVERILRQQGFTAPIPSLTSEWYMQRLDGSFDPKLVGITPPPRKSEYQLRVKTQDALKRGSTESIALRLYVIELLKLIDMLLAGHASRRCHALKVA